MHFKRQIYAEAECNASSIAIAEAQQYKWPQAKYTQKPSAMQARLRLPRRNSINGHRPNIAQKYILMSGKLYIVPTPVGNLEDMTFRAVSVLKNADLILAEDTRTSSVLLKHYDIHGRLESHHKFNEHKMVPVIKDRILAGLDVALISDAGTPGISDPGFLLVRTCVQEGIEVETLPGATAFVPALVSSGFPCDRFCFEGFLPVKKGRQTRLSELAGETRTMIFYESPYRLVKTLEQFAEFFGPERACSVAREISKVHEEHRRGTLAEVAAWYAGHEPKGEIVIIVSGAGPRKKARDRYGADGGGDSSPDQE